MSQTTSVGLGDAADSIALGIMLLAQIFSRSKVTVTSVAEKASFA